MNCTGCHRDNAANRRYCGGCGHNLAPLCGGCGFGNDAGDRFCGGCGDLLAAARPNQRTPIPSAFEQRAPKLDAPRPAPAASPVDELAGLFDAPVLRRGTSALPDSAIGQSHLDSLFGVES